MKIKSSSANLRFLTQVIRRYPSKIMEFQKFGHGIYERSVRFKYSYILFFEITWHIHHLSHGIRSFAAHAANNLSLNSLWQI